MTHAHRHHLAPLKTETPHRSPDGRAAEDRALVERAARHEHRAHGLLAESHPVEVMELDRQIGESDRGTTGPARLLVRKLAAELEHGPALAELRQANELYWTLVLRWRPMLLRRAQVRSARRLSPLTPAALLGVYDEAAFEAAIRFDPSRELSFGTYVYHWLRVRESRDIEHLTLVHGSLGRSYSERAMRVLSIEVAAQPDGEAEGEGLGMQLVDAQPLADEVLAALRCPNMLDEIDAVIPHEHRVLLARLRLGDTLSDAGKHMGLSRERARQLFEMIRAKVAPCGDDFSANMLPVPCRWPRCRAKRRLVHVPYGLCVEHLACVQAVKAVALFEGRVPSVAEVEQVQQIWRRKLTRREVAPCPSLTG